MEELWTALWTDRSGQGLVEYALIIGIVALGLVLVLTNLRDDIGRFISSFGKGLDEAMTS